MADDITPLTAAELAELRNGPPIAVTVERLLCTVLDQADSLALYERTTDQTVKKLEETTATLSSVLGKLSNVKPAIMQAVFNTVFNERMRCFATVSRLEPKIGISADWHQGFHEATLKACAVIMARPLNAAESTTSS